MRIRKRAVKQTREHALQQYYIIVCDKILKYSNFICSCHSVRAIKMTEGVLNFYNLRFSEKVELYPCFRNVVNQKQLFQIKSINNISNLVYTSSFIVFFFTYDFRL